MTTTTTTALKSLININFFGIFVVLCSLVQHLMDLAHQLGCYKVILDCSAEKVAFYERCGLTTSGVQMSKYFGSRDHS